MRYIRHELGNIGCTFKPEINKTSRKILELKRSSRNVHKDLYERSKDIQRNRQKLTEEFFQMNYSFKPKIRPKKLTNYK